MEDSPPNPPEKVSLGDRPDPAPPEPAPPDLAPSKPAPPARPGGMRFAGMGVELAGAFLVGALLGHAVDSFLLTAERPWGMLVGGLLGFTAGMARLIQLARAYYR